MGLYNEITDSDLKHSLYLFILLRSRRNYFVKFDVKYFKNGFTSHVNNDLCRAPSVNRQKEAFLAFLAMNVVIL